MCCIFTCCGWVVDLVQRAWVFFMSCCISSAVCCVLLISSMSGIALGYNYSLAEFVDLKETNVSVYLKRGIFDDEISDETEWRRRGGGPIKGHIADDNLMTGAPEDSDFVPERRAGRRLEDSIIKSNDNYKYEGELMKITAYQPTTRTTVTNDWQMGEIKSSFPPGSPDQLKAIQGLINMKKAEALRNPNDKHASTFNYAAIKLEHGPDATINPISLRRQFGFGPDNIPQPPNRDMDRLEAARKAVPGPSIGRRENWLDPKLPFPEAFSRERQFADKPTYPKPITLNLGPIRPTRPTYPYPRPSHTPKAVDIDTKVKQPTRLADGQYVPKTVMEMDKFNEDMPVDKFSLPRPNPAEQIKAEQGGWKKSEIEYYDEDIKGLPVRKKRNINTIIAELVTETRGVNSEEENVKIKENSNKGNEITLYPNVLLNELLLSNKPLSNEKSFYYGSEENTKIKSSKINDKLNESAKRVVKMIGSTFS